jgi:hypothetical protein
MVARECNVPSLQRNARSAPEGFLLPQSFGRDTLNVLNRGIFSIQVPAIGGAAQARGGTITLSGRSDSRGAITATRVKMRGALRHTAAASCTRHGSRFAARRSMGIPTVVWFIFCSHWKVPACRSEKSA